MQELTYALITPYSLYKSRTGGILGRMLALTNLELVDVRMFIFSDAFVDRFIKVICPDDIDPTIAQAWHSYLDRDLRGSNSWHYAPRCMLLLFRGADAVRHLKQDVIGSFTEAPVGDTIRGTFGDFIRDADGAIRHFEPAVITAHNAAVARKHLQLLAEFGDTDGGVLTNRVHYDNTESIQTTLVMLKPDDFELRSRRPGNVIDVISRTGLKIVGARQLPLTVTMAEQLYGHLESRFVDELKGHVSRQIYARLHDAFAFTFTMHDAEVVGDLLAGRNAIAEFHRIVEYMTGVNPDEISSTADNDNAARTKCLALLYQGNDAVERVRAVLTGGHPVKADAGSYQSEFARNLRRHGAHASESVEAAAAERAIVGLSDTADETSCFAETIRTYLKQTSE